MIVPDTAGVRAGDTDRENTANLLGQALAQGYLPMDEYESRLQTTFAANTRAQLRELTADLPVDRLKRDDPQRRQARRQAARRAVRIHLAGYLTMVAIVLTVWLAVGLTAGSWYFWPVWPILGAGIGVLGHTLTSTATRSSSHESLRGPTRFGLVAPAWPTCSSGYWR
ncbi:DUF1707 domain-containing protein [Mycolicibacterium holsaticum]|uniref:DUF1707 domain-containing protein n=1 Tax=Mycolicibacterium holsaticum TaxID=152142 RepID=UPI001C7D9845|nr:DUF1707 domain-containing protein [Mycolicibacterium holsaticum]MDA4110001.1 hypothetical protein [Mycolicibacterium holsaticum DSM 44478 = JCM 12374]QZA12078.1 DUF1707 domain-containing protein [Mycolicibacterium holsaticum DSM 44478 = JCM 12374]UNC10435.1 DUF1707 domain-containing protein [Mycolicibacterium holsaticum DSM 44478 = JCM 12374]